MKTNTTTGEGGSAESQRPAALKMCEPTQTLEVAHYPGAELTTNDERVRIKVEELIERSTKFIESTIAEAIREGSVSVNDPKTSASQVFSYVLGLLLQARLRNDLNVLRDLQPTVITMVRVKQRVPSDFALSA